MTHDIAYFWHTEALFLPNCETLPDGGALPDSVRFPVKMNRFGQGFFQI